MELNKIYNVDIYCKILDSWKPWCINIYSIYVVYRIYSRVLLTLIRKVSAGPSTSLTSGIADTVAPGAASYRLHLNNISYTVSFSMHIPFAHDNHVSRYFSGSPRALFLKFVPHDKARQILSNSFKLSKLCYYSTNKQHAVFDRQQYCKI